MIGDEEITIIKNDDNTIRTYNKRKPNNEESHGAYLSIFLTIKEKNKLREYCNKRNITSSAFVRKLINENIKEGAEDGDK